MLSLALISYIVVMSITPGPNNLMLASSGVNFGLKRTLPHLVGVSFGVGVLSICMALLLSFVLDKISIIRLPLAIIGCVYLLWISWKLYLAGSPKGKGNIKPLGFFGAILFQWVNPKSWLMVINASILFIPKDLNFIYSAVLLGIFFFCFGFPCVAVWAIMGDRLRKALQVHWRLRVFNTAMASLMAITAIWLLLDEWSLFQG